MLFFHCPWLSFYSITWNLGFLCRLALFSKDIETESWATFHLAHHPLKFILSASTKAKPISSQWQPQFVSSFGRPRVQEGRQWLLGHHPVESSMDMYTYRPTCICVYIYVYYIHMHMHVCIHMWHTAVLHEWKHVCVHIICVLYITDTPTRREKPFQVFWSLFSTSRGTAMHFCWHSRMNRERLKLFNANLKPSDVSLIILVQLLRVIKGECALALPWGKREIDNNRI